MKMEKLFRLALVLLIAAGVMIARPASSEDVYTLYDRMQYKPDHLNQINWEEITFNSFITVAMEKEDVFSLARYMGVRIRRDYSMKELAEINNSVNKTFPYSFNSFNAWHMQSPLETVMLHSGDCKAMANFKFHLLRELGYTNLKIVEVQIPDGRGHIGGHVVTVLNDIWVFDINYPYFYPYAVLRANNGVIKAFDISGAYDIKLEKEIGEDL